MSLQIKKTFHCLSCLDSSDIVVKSFTRQSSFFRLIGVYTFIQKYNALKNNNRFKSLTGKDLSSSKVIKSVSKGILLIATIYISACGKGEFLEDAVDAAKATSFSNSGDIIVVSGGAVVRTVTPFPRHEIIQYSSTGVFKSILYSALSTEFLFGLTFRSSDNSLLIPVDTSDRVDRLPLATLIPTIGLLDVTNLTGANMRGAAVLNDGGLLVIESTTSIEKYTSTSVRVTVNYPKTCGAVSLMHVRKISGGRWVMVCTGLTSGTDAPRVFNDDGTAFTTPTISGAACGVACDPSDIVELPNGNFVVAMQATHSLEVFNSSFTFLGRAYQNTLVLQTPSAMAVLPDGNIVVCSTAFDNCEKFEINGTTATRIGSKAFLADDLIRQPTDILVIP